MIHPLGGARSSQILKLLQEIQKLKKSYMNNLSFGKSYDVLKIVIGIIG